MTARSKFKFGDKVKEISNEAMVLLIFGVAMVPIVLSHNLNDINQVIDRISVVVMSGFIMSGISILLTLLVLKRGWKSSKGAGR